MHPGQCLVDVFVELRKRAKGEEEIGIGSEFQRLLTPGWWAGEERDEFRGSQRTPTVAGPGAALSWTEPVTRVECVV